MQKTEENSKNNCDLFVDTGQSKQSPDGQPSLPLQLLAVGANHEGKRPDKAGIHAHFDIGLIGPEPQVVADDGPESGSP